MVAQIRSHMDSHDLGNTFQSAYKVGHSTETALLSIKNEIHLSLSKGMPTALVLLDLSTAFDTIDHATLLSCLSARFGCAGSALKWFRSYLQDRVQSVKIGSSLLNLFKLKFGVPQGSVLGPLLFPSIQHLLVKSSENILELNTTFMLTIPSCSFSYPLMIVSSLLTVLNPV